MFLITPRLDEPDFGTVTTLNEPDFGQDPRIENLGRGDLSAQFDPAVLKRSSMFFLGASHPGF